MLSTLQSPSIGSTGREVMMGPQGESSSVAGDQDQGDYFSKYEQNPDFRQFVRKLSKCRSIASLDTDNIVSGAEEEKGSEGAGCRKKSVSDDLGQRDYRLELSTNLHNTLHNTRRRPLLGPSS